MLCNAVDRWLWPILGQQGSLRQQLSSALLSGANLEVGLAHTDTSTRLVNTTQTASIGQQLAAHVTQHLQERSFGETLAGREHKRACAMPRSCPQCGVDKRSDKGDCSCGPLPEVVRVDGVIDDGKDVGSGDGDQGTREVAVMVAMNVLRRAVSRAAVEAGRIPTPLSLPGRRPLPAQVARLAVAPMMEWTDRHYRVLARMMTRHTELYTEMIGDAAVVRGPERLTMFNPDLEEPLVLQLGGSSPDQLARAAAICHARG